MSRSIRSLALACLAVGVASLPFTFATPVVVAQEHGQQQHGTMTDANIVALVQAINDSEIGAATAALQEKDVEGDVKDYAQMMMKDHTDNNEDLHKVAEKAGIKPEQNEEIKAMAQKNAEQLKQLKMLDKEAFSRGYVAMNVTAHTEALAALDRAITAVRNPELKEHLEETRKHVQHHLEEATELQTKGNNK